MSETKYIKISKYDIMNMKLKPGIYIKAEPLKISNKTLCGFLVKIIFDDKKHIFSRVKMVIKYEINLKAHYITIHPIKYNLYSREILTQNDKFKKLLILFLDKIENN